MNCRIRQKRILLSSLLALFIAFTSTGTFFLHSHPYTSPAKDDFGCLFQAFEHGIFTYGLTPPPPIPSGEPFTILLPTFDDDLVLEGFLGSPSCRSPPEYLS
jgi:hypothetical protein